MNPYCLKAVKWRNGKGDILSDFVASCRKYDVLPALYVGIRWNSLLGIHNFQAVGDGPFAKNRQTWYKHYCERMVEELCSKYGDFFLIWFDGGADDPNGLGPDVEPIVNKYQPACLFYHNALTSDGVVQRQASWSTPAGPPFLLLVRTTKKWSPCQIGSTC